MDYYLTTNLAFFKSKELNALALGKDIATSLGLKVGLQQIILLMIAVSLAAAGVSVAGSYWIYWIDRASYC